MMKLIIVILFFAAVFYYTRLKENERDQRIERMNRKSEVSPQKHKLEIAEDVKKLRMSQLIQICRNLDSESIQLSLIESKHYGSRISFETVFSHLYTVDLSLKIDNNSLDVDYMIFQEWKDNAGIGFYREKFSFSNFNIQQIEREIKMGINKTNREKNIIHFF